MKSGVSIRCLKTSKCLSGETSGTLDVLTACVANVCMWTY